MEMRMQVRRNSCWFFLLVVSLVLLTALPSIFAQGQRKITKLADGIYEIQHPATGGNVNGNTTVIIGERQVFVVDTCFLPSVAREDIAQIRKWSDKPVAFVLNTHFHNDHNLGNRAYMDAFPALTVIAHVETKREMDLFGPGSAMREEKGIVRLQQMQDTGKGPDGQPLTEDDKKQIKDALAERAPAMEEIKKVKFQSATLTFEHDFTIDLGNREVQVKFLGRGNTPGDAVVYLPKEKIVVAGDLIVCPIPYVYDGYPREWVQTLQNLAQLDADTIVPGHGPVMHDKAYIFLMRDWMQSAVDQMTEQLRKTRPAMFQTLDEVKGSVDLSSFRQRFVGNDKDLGDEYDQAAASLVKVVFEESSLR
jgi:glyoxylase-like metal-dependent hydrolase (beta-lactamase superfamily II)